MPKKLTTEEFIKRAKLLHNNKYDYSKSEYNTAKEKICIICPEHGEFWQTPTDHLSGRGCYKCGIERTKESQKFTTEQFIEKAKQTHGDKYNYSKVNYVNSQTPVIITCPKHGDFIMRPNDHIQGQGCPKCKLIFLRNKFSLTTEQFIKKAREIHGNKYVYSKVKYVNNRTKVCIICPKHGEFWQTPDKHLQGCNCPKCNKSRLEEKVSLILSKNNIDFEEQKHFEWLGRQSLDFFLPKFSIGIECQGVEHFKPVERFKGSGGFENTNERDVLKYRLCGNNKVKLLYYTNLKEYNTFLNESLIKNEDDLIKVITENNKNI